MTIRYDRNPGRVPVWETLVDYGAPPARPYIPPPAERPWSVGPPPVIRPDLDAIPFEPVYDTAVIKLPETPWRAGRRRRQGLGWGPALISLGMLAILAAGAVAVLT